MPHHPWGASTPEMNAMVLETGSTSATWAAASASWLGLASATMATIRITGGQLAASLASISGVRSMVHAAATPPFLTWLGTMAGIAFKQAAICAVVAESYGMARSSMIPSMQSINNRVREAAAEASNFFGQNTPLIVALNAEYGAYTVENASIGTTYGEVITAATLPVPIPPPPLLANAASAASDAGDALSQAGQLAAQAGGNGLSQTASQASSAVGQSSGVADPAGAMGQLSSLMSAPMQALSSPMQGVQQLLSAPMQAFGSMSSLGSMLGGGSTGSSFSPVLAGATGLPLGSSSPVGASGGGVGLAGFGGMGGIGAALTSRSESANASSSRTSVLSGIATAPTQEKLTGVTSTGGPGMIPPGTAASADRARRGGETTVVAHTGTEEDAPRRGATGSERDFFA